MNEVLNYMEKIIGIIKITQYLLNTKNLNRLIKMEKTSILIEPKKEKNI